jgi:hypothetical protein
MTRLYALFLLPAAMLCLWPASAQSTASLQSAEVTGTWLATDVPYAPWAVQLKQDGAKLSGTMEQNGGLRGQVEIYEGKIDGPAISFKAKSPDGARAITFTGTINGDEMVLNRSTEILTNASQGGTGLFGTNAAPQFTIHRTSITGSSATAPPVAVASTAPRAIPRTGPSGRWMVANVANGPWIFVLSARGAALVGTVNQQGSSSIVGIAGGKATDTSVSFTVLSPDAERLVAFNGRVNGDEISFVRTITPLPGGSRGGNDLYGASAPLQFIAKRAASAAMPAVSTAPAGPPKKIEYKGVEIDVTSIQSLSNYPAAIDSLHRQIDIVEAALPDPAQIAFLKSIPLVFAPSVNSGSDNALYSNGRVVLTTLIFSPEKPVILHELMHAYHDLKVPNGFSNAGILKLFEQARSGGQFPAGSYMLISPGEYFAMMSSVYLHGTAARDPFTRQAIKEKQPDCYQWMVKEFGQR